MSLALFQILLAASSIVSLAAGIWLFLHLTAVTHLFAGTADVVPARKPRRASRSAVWTALVLFNAGWIVSVVLWSMVD